MATAALMVPTMVTVLVNDVKLEKPGRKERWWRDRGNYMMVSRSISVGCRTLKINSIANYIDRVRFISSESTMDVRRSFRSATGN